MIRQILRSVQIKLGWRDCPACGEFVRVRWVKDCVLFVDEPPMFFHWECPRCRAKSNVQPTFLITEALASHGLSIEKILDPEESNVDALEAVNTIYRHIHYNRDEKSALAVLETYAIESKSDAGASWKTEAPSQDGVYCAQLQDGRLVLLEYPSIDWLIVKRWIGPFERTLSGKETSR